MKRWIEPLMAAAWAALLASASAQDPPPPRICEHPGGGPTTPADVAGARRVLEAPRFAVPPLSLARPAPPKRPRCGAGRVRTGTWKEMPLALAGERVRIESTDGVSEEILRDLDVRCVPTEVRFFAGGAVEWAEGP
jgi:hypothetical protein